MTLADLVTSSSQTVYVSGAVYRSDALITALPIIGGSVTADGRRAKMRDATVQFGITTELNHDDLYALLSDQNVEITLERGFEAVDRTRTGVALGRFVVDELTYLRTPAGTSLSATLSDLSVRISRNRWVDPYTIASGTTLATALNAVLTNRWTRIRSGITEGTPAGTIAAPVVLAAGEGSDPWGDACSLAESFGVSLFFDAAGVARTAPAPTLDPAVSAFTFARGATAITTQQSRVAVLQNTYNGIVVTGESPDITEPVRGEAWDTNPASPTYYLGPFGKAPKFYTSTFITTQNQAQGAADSMLAAVLGHAERLEWSQVVHPGLSPFDVVLVELAAGVLTPFILDALTIPLAVGETATATARTITVQS